MPLTAEQEKAVYEVFSSRGVNTSMSAEWEVTQAQHILGTGDQLSPHRQEIFEAILKAVGAEPIAHAPAPRSRVDSRASPASVAAHAEEDLTLLGIAADGRQLTVGLAATADPLAFLTAGCRAHSRGQGDLAQTAGSPDRSRCSLEARHRRHQEVVREKRPGLHRLPPGRYRLRRAETPRPRDSEWRFWIRRWTCSPRTDSGIRQPAPAPASAPVASTATDQLARDKELAARLGISL